jgi:hypothetical protein
MLPYIRVLYMHLHLQVTKRLSIVLITPSMAPALLQVNITLLRRLTFVYTLLPFFSGGADNVVVIWKSTGQGMLKYNHTSGIQRVCYNPATLMLASCSEVGTIPTPRGCA